MCLSWKMWLITGLLSIISERREVKSRERRSCFKPFPRDFRAVLAWTDSCAPVDLIQHLVLLCAFFICIPVWFIVWHLKDIFHNFFFFFPPDWSAHEEVLLAASSERWPGLGRIPARLSCWPQFFHAVINAADNAALRGSFSQDPQHTATHSDGVTRTFATEPPLSEAQRAARPGSAAAPRISGSLRQAAHHWYRWRSECVCANLETRWKCLRKRNEVIWKGALEEMQPKVRLEKLGVASNTPQFSQIIAAPGTFL